MRILRKITSIRHFIMLSLLAVILNVVSLGPGTAAGQTKARRFTDPVISGMTWETPTGNAVTNGVDDVNFGCPTNGVCNINCNAPAICNGGNNPTLCNIPQSC